MAAAAYPHIIFATGPDVITKELLHEVLAEAYPQGTVTDAPLSSVLALGDYTFTFWFDDEADGLAQRYAGYLPEGARRRRLNACTTMIDFSGDADPGQAHRQDAERIVTNLAELDGVWVFSEESKRFVAFDYGPPPAEAPGLTPAEPVAETETPPLPVDHPIEPAVDSTWAPEAEPTPALPLEVSEAVSPPEVPAASAEPEPAPQPPREPTPEVPTTPSPARPEPDKPRFFQRFSRKNQ